MGKTIFWVSVTLAAIFIGFSVGNDLLATFATKKKTS